MDHYPEFNVSERECPREDWSSSRHDSASSINKAAIQHSIETKSDSQESDAPPQYTSFPTPSIHSEAQPVSRSDSVYDTSSDEKDIKSNSIEAEYARYTDAPPPYSAKQYEGKSEEERSSMRKRDYARELSRMMGRQLVRGLKSEKTESK